MLHVRRLSDRLAPLRPMMIDDLQPKPKVQLNQYLLEAKIGEGANAKVYLAVDSKTDKKYAAKAIQIGHRGGPFTLDREIKLMRSLRHPSIIELLEVLHRQDTNTAYLIMDYAPFGSLKGKRFDEGDIASTFHQIVSAVTYLHENSYVHQDIKPSNILLFEDGTAKIADFGIGHSFESADMVIGSPAYQAPEIFDDRNVDFDPAKEDVWSLGVTIYEAAFGKLPYSGDSVYEIAAAVKAKPLEIPDTASPELKDLLSHVLVVDPALRYTAKEVLEHPFFASPVKRRFDFPLHKPVMKQSQSLVSVQAEVCGRGYSFAEPSGPNSLSWPGGPRGRRI